MKLTTAKSPSNWILLALCLGAGLAGLSVSITGPILVDITKSFAITVALAGQLMTVGSFAGMIGTFILSPLLDRIGRREAICLALADLAVASLFCAVAPNFIVMAIAYGFIGLGGYTLLALVLATVGDIYSRESLGKAMGWITAGNVGFMILLLPVTAKMAEQFGWISSFLFYGGLSLIAGIYAYRILPAGLHSHQQGQVSYIAAFRSILTQKSVIALMITVVVYHAATYGVGTYLGAFAKERLLVSTAAVGPLFSVRSLGTALGGILLGRFAFATNWRTAACAALACAISNIAIYVVSPSGMIWLGAMAFFHGLTIGVLDVSINCLLSMLSGGRGAIMATRSVMDSLGGVIGPALGGIAIDISGYGAAGWLYAILAIIGATSVTLGARRPAENTSEKVA